MEATIQMFPSIQVFDSVEVYVATKYLGFPWTHCLSFWFICLFICMYLEGWGGWDMSRFHSFSTHLGSIYYVSDTERHTNETQRDLGHKRFAVLSQVLEILWQALFKVVFTSIRLTHLLEKLVKTIQRVAEFYKRTRVRLNWLVIQQMWLTRFPV